MKTTIFYFSGTGNCLKVCRDLAKELGEVNIVNLAKVINQEIDLSADSIGIVYPVYMFGQPLIISRFIKKLENTNSKYIFAVATYGGMAGNSLGQSARELKKQGLKLSAGFLVKMPGNYTPLYEAIPEDKQQHMFEKEGLKIKEIAKIIRAKKETEVEKNSFIFNLIFSGIIYRIMSPRIPLMDREFWVDDNCNSCGICLKVCPVNNIKLNVGRKPYWLHRCEQCFACLHWCPQEAIQYGRKTPGRKRYRNPHVRLEDFF